jgi:hypothetical protein
MIVDFACFGIVGFRARGRAGKFRASCLKHRKNRPNARVVSLKGVLVDAPLLPQLDRLFPGLERRRLDAFLDVVEDGLLVVLQATDQDVDLVDLPGGGFQQCGVLDHWSGPYERKDRSRSPGQLSDGQWEDRVAGRNHAALSVASGAGPKTSGRRV